MTTTSHRSGFSFGLTDEQLEIKQMLRKFFQEVAPIAKVAELDDAAEYPEEILSAMAELGLWGMAIHEEYGGSPLDHVTRCVAVEEIQRAGSSVSYAFIPTALFCADGLRLFGTEEQRTQLLPDLAAGRLRLAMGLSEPDSGSDLMSLSTRATRDGDHYVVRGQKIFITGADTAKYILTLVRTNPGAPSSRSAMSMLFIPTDAPGVTIVPLKKLMGQGTHTCEVFLDDVTVPADLLLGSENNGTEIVFELLDADRVYTAAQSLGIAQGAFDIARKYAGERSQFGRPIIEHQAIGHLLADMELSVESARLVVYHAAWRLDQGLPCSRESAMAKITATEAGTSCALNGTQVLGGYGVMVEYGMERLYREAKIQEIFGGTNQILRNVLARTMGAAS
jgi:alkylation response protein AidB-like acyl-CoA dehydrogenase